MVRANLGQLLGNVDDAKPPVGEPVEPATPTRQEAPARGVEKTTDVSDSATSDSSVLDATAGSAARVRAIRKAAPTAHANETPTYLRFVRKETRLREDQQNELTVHARRLNRARSQTGIRITENSLIRIAVDLLLDRIETATGDDEAALRESLKR